MRDRSLQRVRVEISWRKIQRDSLDHADLVDGKVYLNEHVNSHQRKTMNLLRFLNVPMRIVKSNGIID